MAQDWQPKVLIVDDSKTERFWEERVLKGMGCLVETAQDGTEALRHLLQNGDIDLIMLDLGMPRMDGFEFLAEMAKMKEHAHVKVIVLSGRGEDEVIPVLKEGAHDYWLKGESTFVLKNKIKNLIHIIKLETQLRQIRALLED
jgi:CheY-like chemotaxis protein